MAKASTKTKPKKTTKTKVKDIYIHFILDRSGSMRSMWPEVQSGFTQFLKEQKDLGGEESYLSLTTFDTVVEFPVDLEELKDLDGWNTKWAEPRGMTALYDAVCTGIQETEDWVDDNDWEGEVLIVILTDGYENSSQENKLEDVRLRIKSAEDKGWIVSFLASNQDAWDTYSAYGGQNVGTTQSYNAGIGGQTVAVIANASAATTAMRTGASYNMAKNINPDAQENKPKKKKAS